MFLNATKDAAAASLAYVAAKRAATDAAAIAATDAATAAKSAAAAAEAKTHADETEAAMAKATRYSEDCAQIQTDLKAKLATLHQKALKDMKAKRKSSGD
jgi:hypothetical protein